MPRGHRGVGGPASTQVCRRTRRARRRSTLRAPQVRGVLAQRRERAGTRLRVGGSHRARWRRWSWRRPRLRARKVVGQRWERAAACWRDARAARAQERARGRAGTSRRVGLRLLAQWRRGRAHNRPGLRVRPRECARARQRDAGAAGVRARRRVGVLVRTRWLRDGAQRRPGLLGQRRECARARLRDVGEAAAGTYHAASTPSLSPSLFPPPLFHPSPPSPLRPSPSISAVRWGARRCLARWWWGWWVGLTSRRDETVSRSSRR